jgi:hypothetical protein
LSAINFMQVIFGVLDVKDLSKVYYYYRFINIIWSSIDNRKHNCGRELGNGGINQAAASGHKCACPPPPPRARSCNPSPPWADGRTKIVGQRACVRRSMAGNSSRCSLPSPLAMSCNPSSSWADGCQRSQARQLAPKGINPRVVENTFACIIK